jgi:hypothetical protein
MLCFNVTSWSAAIAKAKVFDGFVEQIKGRTYFIYIPFFTFEVALKDLQILLLCLA